MRQLSFSLRFLLINRLRILFPVAATLYFLLKNRFRILYNVTKILSSHYFKELSRCKLAILHNENTLAQAVVAACVAKAAKPPKRSKLPPPIVSSVMLGALIQSIRYVNHFSSIQMTGRDRPAVFLKRSEKKRRSVPVGQLNRQSFTLPIN